MSRLTLTQPKSEKKPKPAIKQVRTFRSAVNYLDSLTNYERVKRALYTPGNFGLARMNRLLAAIGNPQRSFKSIHVAGTKGKGSTAAMLAAMLRGCGFKVALYTSPHILDIRERIVVGDQMISETAFTRAIDAIAKITAQAKVASPTYFEVLTAAAFKYFADQDIDLAIVETGMGGRLDSTNVINPEIVALTSISLDHSFQLGNTLPAIAREKAGIIKKGVPVISAPQPPEVKEVFREAAEAAGSTLRFSDENVGFSYRFEFSRAAGRHARICLTTANSRFEHLHVPLFGEHQATNCAVALNVLDVLKTKGYAIDDQEAMAGLAKVKLPGRMQIIAEDPRILVDGAHNAASINALMRGIGQHIAYDSMIVIFACQRDKDIPGMIRRLQLGADKIIFTTVGSPRSADPNELAAEYSEHSGKMVQVAANLKEALHIAQSAITREDLICITGSFYLVAQALRQIPATDL